MLYTIELILNRGKQSQGFFKVAKIPNLRETLETNLLSDPDERGQKAIKLFKVVEVRHHIFADKTPYSRLACDCVAKIYITPITEK